MRTPGSSQLLEAATAFGSAGAALASAHAAYNRRLLIRPVLPPPVIAESVAVLLPVRDEQDRVEACLEALLATEQVPDLVVVVLDDCSTDATAARVQTLAEKDPRVRLLAGTPPPEGWLGKPHACHQLAEAVPDADVLVFLDADVVLHPAAVAAAVATMRGEALDLVSPYPRQIADGLGPRLVQPLLQWSWLTFLPLRRARTSPRPSLSAANGQLLAVDAEVYRRAGGHAAQSCHVLEDLALVRAVKRAGGRGGVTDGTALATTTMYADWPALRDGYTKSLWAAFGSPVGAVGVAAVLALLYLVPPVAAAHALLRGRPVAAVLPAIGYAASVAGRVVAAGATGGRRFPDALAHPVSIGVLLGLTARSFREHRAGRTRWKGRPV